MKGSWRLLLALPLAIALLAGMLIWRAQSLASRQPPARTATVPEIPAAAGQAALGRLSRAVAIPTVSWQEPQAAASQTFERLFRNLEQSFPRVYQELHPQRVGNGLLIQWPGTQAGLKPVLMAAHLDVVPPGPASGWQQGAFSGKRTGGYLWGRGTLDDKGCALGLLEALDARLAKGIKPKHTIYLAFGADEEIGGHQGAEVIAATLKRRGVRLEAVLDEGMAIVPGSMIKLAAPVALIGIAEKGYLTIELSVDQPGGHSSMPPADTAVDILSRALLKLHQHPLPARLAGPAGELFSWLAPEMTGLNRLALANRWLFEPMLISQLAQKPSTNALMRTTIAPTVIQGSNKENVLASQARALVNLRVLPGDTPKMILAHFARAIGDDRVRLKPISDPAVAEASRVSRTDSAFFGLLGGAIRQIFPQALIAPTLVLAATDSRHYEPIADDIYRFMPVPLAEADFDRIHGPNERISEAGYLGQVRFYQQLLASL